MYGCSCSRSTTGSPSARIGASASSASAQVAAVADGHGADPLAVPLLRHERRGGRAQEDQPHGAARAAPRSVIVAVRAQDLVGALERPGDQAAVDGRADLVQAEREPGDDAEVARRRRGAPRTGRRSRRGWRVRIAPSAVTISTSTGCRPSSRSGASGSRARRRASGRRRRPRRRSRAAWPARAPASRGRRRRAGSRAPTCASCAPGSTVTSRMPRHVERQAAVGERGAGDVVAAALDAEQQAVLAGELDGAATSSADAGWTTSAGVWRPSRSRSARLVPALVARRSSDPSRRRPGRRAARRQRGASAVESCDVDARQPRSVRHHAAQSSAPRTPRAARSAGRRPQSSITCSGQPWRRSPPRRRRSGVARSCRPQISVVGTAIRCELAGRDRGAGRTAPSALERAATPARGRGCRPSNASQRPPIALAHRRRGRDAQCVQSRSCVPLVGLRQERVQRRAELGRRARTARGRARRRAQSRRSRRRGSAAKRAAIAPPSAYPTRTGGAAHVSVDQLAEPGAMRVQRPSALRAPWPGRSGAITRWRVARAPGARALQCAA